MNIPADSEYIRDWFKVLSSINGKRSRVEEILNIAEANDPSLVTTLSFYNEAKMGDYISNPVSDMIPTASIKASGIIVGDSAGSGLPDPSKVPDILAVQKTFNTGYLWRVNERDNPDSDGVVFGKGIEGAFDVYTGTLQEHTNDLMRIAGYIQGNLDISVGKVVVPDGCESIWIQTGGWNSAGPSMAMVGKLLNGTVIKDDGGGTNNPWYYASQVSRLRDVAYSNGEMTGQYPISAINPWCVWQTMCILGDWGAPHYYKYCANINTELKTNFYIFYSEEEALEYLETGDYTKALNYSRPASFDYMNLNVEGNSEVPNATYEFIEPVAGLAYDTPQQIKMEWNIEGASKNPFVRKEICIDIPRNAHCFVLFTGKYMGVYCNMPGVKMTMDVRNGESPLGQVVKQSDTGLLEIQDIFGMYEGYEPEGGTYIVKIYTPYIFIRQIYKCASRDQLPQKGEPTYEIFQPGTSSAYVNPNDTGELAATHLLSFASLADMKAASDAEYGGGNG